MKTIWTHIERHHPKGPYITVSDLENRKVRFIACAGGEAPPTLVELDRSEVLTLVSDLTRYLSDTA